MAGWVHPFAILAVLRFRAQVTRHACMRPTLSAFVGFGKVGFCRTLGGLRPLSVESMSVSVLSEALAAWRTEKGWSQREAANAVDAAPSTWNDWEKGDVRPHPKKLGKIADTFEKPRDEIYRLYAESAEEPV